jgi:outer membrane lipoprotein SlyB
MTAADKAQPPRAMARILSSSVLLTLASVATAFADEHPPLQICLAPASAQMAFGNSVDAISAVRDTFTSFLTGPSISVTSLNARLVTQAREEAKLSDCPYVLFPTVRHERRTTGLLGRIAAGAVQSGAWQAAGAAPSSATRVLAGATSAGAANVAIAGQIREQDSLTLEYRLESADGRTLVEKKTKRSASSNGEDLLTPLVQGAAETVVSTLSASSH